MHQGGLEGDQHEQCEDAVVPVLVQTPQAHTEHLHTGVAPFIYHHTHDIPIWNILQHFIFKKATNEKLGVSIYTLLQGLSRLICNYILCLQPIKENIQETPQCDETRFSTLQPSIDMTGIRNERWQ